MFTPEVSGTNLQYLWTPNINLNNNTIKNPVLTGKNNVTYTLRVTSISSCIAEDTLFIRVLKPIGIPNIFTPNGDGIHDVWNIPELYNYPGATVIIFTRSGQKIFSSVGYDMPWNGTYNGHVVPVATYYYIIDTKYTGKLLSGSVTIVR